MKNIVFICQNTYDETLFIQTKREVDESCNNADEFNYDISFTVIGKLDLNKIKHLSFESIKHIEWYQTKFENEIYQEKVYHTLYDFLNN